jgi:hypothetical protein
MQNSECRMQTMYVATALQCLNSEFCIPNYVR